MQSKTLITLAAILASALALPAYAQSTSETNLDQHAAKKEAHKARGNQLTDVTPEQAHANELNRCNNLPQFYRSDCIARVNQQGQSDAQGSVLGGGIFRETKTTMSQEEYNRAREQSSMSH